MSVMPDSLTPFHLAVAWFTHKCTNRAGRRVLASHAADVLVAAHRWQDADRSQGDACSQSSTSSNRISRGPIPKAVSTRTAARITRRTPCRAQVLYISPLALSNDIRLNLEGPFAGIGEELHGWDCRSGHPRGGTHRRCPRTNAPRRAGWHRTSW